MAVVRYMPGEALFGRPLPAWKRCLDITGASAGLVLLSPLLVAVALYVKGVSRGPVLFRQTRVGRGGREFQMIKFRTMHPNVDTDVHRAYLQQLIRDHGKRSGAPGKAMEKIDRDPRIIPFGSLIRKLCLDELPQLVNVLRGDMTLIGPRPAIPYEADAYERWHTQRLDAVPGMTGLWQVSGKNRLTFCEMVALDIRYTRELSFWLDAKILLKTVPAILGQFREFFERK